MSSPITTNADIKAAFVDWSQDHYKHFGCWPGSFIYPMDDEASDIEYTEAQVWAAHKELGHTD